MLRKSAPYIVCMPNISSFIFQALQNIEEKHMSEGGPPLFIDLRAGRLAKQASLALFLLNKKRAGSGNRTRMTSLEGWDITIMLCPHV